MDVVANRVNLLRTLQFAQGVVERKSTVPILGNVLISAEENTLRIRATDLDIEAVLLVEAEVRKQGETTVSAAIFLDILRKLSADYVEIKEVSQSLHILSGSSKFTLLVMPSEQFPKISSDSFDTEFEIEAKSLCRLIDKTRFAMLLDETRFYLNGIFLHVNEDEGGSMLLRAVATDAHRMACVGVPLPQGAEGMPAVIVPRKTVIELRRLLDSLDKNVKVEVASSKIRFSCNNFTLTSKLVDGRFPDYKSVIPAKEGGCLELHARKLLEAVDRVSVLSSDKTRLVKMTIGTAKQNNNIIISVDNPESGSAEEEVEAVYSGEPMDISFNSKYLIDIAAQLGDHTSMIYLRGKNSAALVIDSQDENSVYVIMPMRV